MSRSRASAKKAGAWFERQIADYLAEHLDHRIDRRVRTGAKDKGDIANLYAHFQRVVVECKNESGTPSLGTWARETETERINDGALAGVTVHKRHGKAAAGDQWVTCTLRDFVALINGIRPPDQEET